MGEQRNTLLGVGVRSGLEAEYQARAGVVYVRDPDDEEQAAVRVSPARWSRFLASVKADQFVPQQEGDEVTIAIGDLSHTEVVQRPSFVTTSRHAWEIFVKAVKSSEFDHLGA
ncbi:DUF397 domain-containing protein [Sphaerimonospora sp. CA-214678]|uniref:DUF397 domain-containing protein n=1 Tax=Sphaerimonospora sp. CA-214678 TaxID=3240029 RepID=UPI003D94279F